MINIKDITLSLNGTSDLNDIDTLALLQSPPKGAIDPNSRIAVTTNIMNTIRFKTTHYFGCELPSSQSKRNSKTGRHRMTIKANLDNGEMRLENNSLLLDEDYGFGYSCLTSISDDMIGILYEGSGVQLIFQQIPIYKKLSHNTNYTILPV